MAESGNILFLYDNLVDRAASLTASSAATPVARLQDFRPTRPWVAAGCALEHILIDAGEPALMTHGALAAYDMDVDGTIQCRVSNDPLIATDPDAAELLFDDTEEAWSPVGGLGDDGFGVSGGGYPILGGNRDHRSYKVFNYGAEALFARYTLFTLRNPTLGRQLRVGRAFTGLGVQPANNFDWNWGWEWVDPSEVIETEESVFLLRRRKYRVLRVTLPDLKQGEAITDFDDLKRIVGKSLDLIMVLFPLGDEPLRSKMTVHGLPLETAALSNPYFNQFATSIAVRELPYHVHV